MSQRVARFNKVVTNRTIGRVAPWMPGFGVVHHRGRRSGREFHSPVNVFRTSDGYVFALTYGSRADWVRNVLAAGGCDLETRRQVVHLAEPRLYVDTQAKAMPGFIRVGLRLGKVDEFLELKIR
ncbi:nitroreductase family deazaflavin-dependent oxidoreductase [Fodinicola feengrottensis]|uniref:Nitroreductase family deazaflavin-dependent oxidoreductase n=2 Tax=Fodinicola feengrottensis TaxID=435914 RepID=A0ABN2IW01_9ACTN